MSHDSDMATCIKTKCHACDHTIWVPIHDYSEARNYCYPCAMAKLAYVPEIKENTHDE